MDRKTEVLEDWKRAYPDAVQLARVTSLAVRIDPSFLREARLQLVPGVPSDAEADLWFSPLVESRSAAGFVLNPAIKHGLQEWLAQDEALFHRAWALRQRFHPYLMPEMRLEEEVSWLSLVEPDDGKLNEALLRSVRAMNEGRERALGVARWALRAIPRLPERALKTEAGLALVFGTSGHLGYSPMLFHGTGEAPLSQELLRAVVATTSAHGTCRVGMRLRENALELVEPPSDDLRSVLELPDTHPRLLELSWNAPQPGRKLLAAEPMTITVPIPAGVRDLRLRSIQGDFQVTASNLPVEQQAEAPGARTIARAGTPTGQPSIGATLPPEDDSTPPEERPLDEFPPFILRWTVERAEEQDLRELILEDESVIVVEAPDGYGKRTLVRRVHASLQRGPQRSFLATVRLPGHLIDTKGFSNNLAIDLPYEQCATRKFPGAPPYSAYTELASDMRSKAVALIEEKGAAGLEQFLEQDFLPYFQDSLLLILVDGLDSISIEQADEFVRLLSGWAWRSNGPWSCLRLIITATPGVARLPEAVYRPLAGLDAERIRQLARILKSELEADAASYLEQLTGGCVRFIDEALREWPGNQDLKAERERSQGLTYELVWDDVLRRRIKSYPDWLGRFPEIMEALGSVTDGFQGTPSALARLLDVGVLEKTRSGYAIRARLFDPLALYAREKAQPPGYDVDVYINAAPGELPAWLEDFLDQLRQRLERYLGRPLRVWSDPQGNGEEGPLFRSWVMVNILTRAFYKSRPCMVRMRTFERKEEETSTPLCLYVRADTGALHEQAVLDQTVDLSEPALLPPNGESPAQLDKASLWALRAANMLVPMMLHAPDAPDPMLDMYEVLQKEDSAEKEEMLQLIDIQKGAVEDAIYELVPARLHSQTITSDKLPSNDHAGTVSTLGKVSFSLEKRSLELEGGGSATISADVEVEDVQMYVYIEKSTYWGMDERTLSFFPLSQSDWNESMVETQPTVTLRAKALLRIDTETSEDDIRSIISVDVDELTDVEIVNIYEHFSEPHEPEE